MTYYGWLTEGSAFAQKPLLGKWSRDYVLDALKGVEIIEKLPAQLKIKLVAEFGDSFTYMLRLNTEVFLVVKTLFHIGVQIY